MRTQEEKEKLTKDLSSALMPFGYLDLQVAAEVLADAEISESDFSIYVEEFCEETQIPFNKLDICYLAYEYVLQEARNQIDEILGIDIINDTDNFYTYGNYMCSGYDCNEESNKKISAWIREIEETRAEEMTPQIKFIESQLY